MPASSVANFEGRGVKNPLRAALLRAAPHGARLAAPFGPRSPRTGREGDDRARGKPTDHGRPTTDEARGSAPPALVEVHAGSPYNRAREAPAERRRWLPRRHPVASGRHGLRGSRASRGRHRSRLWRAPGWSILASSGGCPRGGTAVMVGRAQAGGAASAAGGSMRGRDGAGLPLGWPDSLGWPRTDRRLPGAQLPRAGRLQDVGRSPPGRHSAHGRGGCPKLHSSASTLESLTWRGPRNVRGKAAARKTGDQAGEGVPCPSGRSSPSVPSARHHHGLGSDGRDRATETVVGCCPGGRREEARRRGHRGPSITATGWPQKAVAAAGVGSRRPVVCGCRQALALGGDARRRRDGAIDAPSAPGTLWAELAAHGGGGRHENNRPLTADHRERITDHRRVTGLLV